MDSLSETRSRCVKVRIAGYHVNHAALGVPRTYVRIALASAQLLQRWRGRGLNERVVVTQGQQLGEKLDVWLKRLKR